MYGFSPVEFAVNFLDSGGCDSVEGVAFRFQNPFEDLWWYEIGDGLTVWTLSENDGNLKNQIVLLGGERLLASGALILIL